MSCIKREYKLLLDYLKNIYKSASTGVSKILDFSKEEKEELTINNNNNNTHKYSNSNNNSIWNIASTVSSWIPFNSNENNNNNNNNNNNHNNIVIKRRDSTERRNLADLWVEFLLNDVDSDDENKNDDQINKINDTSPKQLETSQIESHVVETNTN